MTSRCKCSSWVWSSFYWDIKKWNFPVLDTWSNQEWLGITLLASELRTVLSPPCTISTNSLDLLSELRRPCGAPSRYLEELHVVSWHITDLVSEKPDSLLCFGSSGESQGQGTNSRRLHPEVLSIYPYVQSSWLKRIVCQVGFGREHLFWTLSASCCVSSG